MFNRSLVLGAALIAAVSIFLSRPTLDLHPPYVQGRNGTALFLVNEQHGLSNVHVATASALLENDPDIEVHFASFPRLKAKLERIKQLAQKTNSEARIAFHRLQGPSMFDAHRNAGRTVMDFPHPPGISEEHFSIYNELKTVIDKVDPAVVVLDTVFIPAIEATREKNRQYAVITPNQYPAMASGFPYPLPWRKIPENLYLNLRVIYSVIRMPELAAKRKWLPAKGIADPLNFLGAYRHDAPWVTVTTEGASIPADYIPPNVTATNPIILSVAPAPELVEWLKKAPTILINLGSTVMLNVQFLWKFNKYGNYSNNIFLPVQRYIENGQLRLERWLTVDPTSILETGRFIASVHHGGANCYNEAVYAGIPQIVMPLWADLYNYAVLVESIGIGVWACPNTSPDWTVEKLALAILKVVDGGKASLLMRSKARELGNRIQASEKGRDIAARKVAELAHTGNFLDQLGIQHVDLETW
ncbi:hypothetical protein BKA59DRAFT_489468 [Fusarium tricinctum]|uniref:Erythromycin biosynthesis protein CIII-like C-terminal domain-containing protein n=1 Tax=Fusarium tricinctum TaxID=61284 RepID=A0A8K0S7U8_9HYPO|nr:hypothetical protein BKA59DRAFT_489468 [Fusarium tricinctum]